MMKCLKMNQVCSEQHRKCKECRLDDCREAMKILEEHEQKIENIKIKNIKKQLPKECQECNMYKITDIEKQKVHCPYRIGNFCVIK